MQGSDFGCCTFCRGATQTQLSKHQPSFESVDLKDIKAIIDLMKKNSVSEFELEKQDFKIKLKRGGSTGAIVNMEESAAIAYATPAAARNDRVGTGTGGDPRSFELGHHPARAQTVPRSSCRIPDLFRYLRFDNF